VHTKDTYYDYKKCNAHALSTTSHLYICVDPHSFVRKQSLIIQISL